MSLENYLVKSSVSYEEILFEFHSEEKQQLYNLLKELGYDQYREWFHLHLSEAVKYIGLSRSQRMQKKWVNHPDNLLIRLAALQISHSALIFQNDIVKVDAIVDGGSYRQFHAVIAEGVANLITRTAVTYYYPFPCNKDPFRK